MKFRDSNTGDLFGANGAGSNFNPTAAKQAKTLGMEQVERHADEDWKSTMLHLVEAVARERQFFTSDHVFKKLELNGAPPVTTHDLRAFGPIMLRAAKLGLCRKANCAGVNSERASLHGSPRAVWQSLIFEE